jgi:hypothetical protein
MSEEHRPSKKTQLALAVAQGESVAEWARTNEVPRRTAFRWAKEVSVRTAVGRMAGRANWAVKGITTLAAGAESESVRLRALRAMLSDMMAVAKFSGLEQRMTQIEVQLNERVGNAGRPG